MRVPGGAGAGSLLVADTGCGGRGVQAAELPRWASSKPVHPAANQASIPLRPYDEQVNQRLAIWHGDITTLQVDAVANSTNETLDECNVHSAKIFAGAGSSLKHEIFTKNKECRVGEVCVTGGHGLLARHILHTVCPKFAPQHRTAAESLLRACYRNVLDAAVGKGARSVAVCPLDTPRHGFPPDLAAHIAIGSIRQFLERVGGALVVLCLDTEAQIALYEQVCALYFPRAPPAPCPPAPPASLPSRLRIIHNPHQTVSTDDGEEGGLSDDDASAEAAAAFARMSVSPDTQRLLAAAPLQPPLHSVMRHQIDHQERYDRLLRRARSEDLSEVSGIGCLYQSGVDRLGRPVVVFIGKWFPITDIDLDKALLYLIKLLDPIVRGDYVIAYFHTLASGNNHPPFSWLKEVYTVLPYKYKKNLKAFYIVHPTFWTKMMTWWFTTFMAPAIKAKVHNLPGVEYLYSVMDRNQLDVPAFVIEYDMTINGLHYFQPDAPST